jgi:glutamate-1-semialdehyde 2,1-aminomutase
MPVGAYGGRAEIMAKVSPTGPVFQAGTLSGNPVAMAAGLTTLRELQKDPPYQRLDRLAATLADGMDRIASQAGIAHTVPRVGSMFTFFFNPDPVTDYTVATRSDTKTFARLFWGMMARGIYLPCSQFEAMFLSTAHTEAHVQQTLDAFREVVAEIQST